VRTFKRIAAVAALLLLVLAAWLGWLYVGSTEDYPVAAPPAPAAAPLAPFVPSSPPASGDSVLVVLVFDGLSTRSIQSVPTPNFTRLAAEGSHTGAMLPVYPTLSMPNHFSLSTGCYPERHGIVSNRFIDPERGLYQHEKGDVSWLFDCEPINVVAERQGMRSAILGWVGATHGRKALASVVDEYRQPLPSIAARTARVLELLAKPAGERPRLIIAYNNEPDSSLHVHGFAAEPAKAAMRAADAAVGQVLQALGQPDLRGRSALIVISDHGMVDAVSHINVERILRNADIDATFAGDGATAHVYLRDPSTRAAALAKLQGHAHVTAFSPERPPAYAHVGTSARNGDLVIQTKPGDYVFDRGMWPKHLRWAAMYGSEVLSGRRFAGMHGYPPETPGMQSVFYAWGARIARGVKLDGMRAIDVHPTMATWLGMAPGSPLDGRARDELFLPIDAAVAVPAAEVPAAEASDAGIPH
jgi:predicted AlkP superfamily pyrophosphatase or phosphodiesterase